MATRGGDKQQPGAPPLSFRRAVRAASVILAGGGRSSFPLPLGGEGRVRGGRWRHLEPLGASPLSLRLRLRGASPPLPSTPLALRSGRRLDPLPRWGRGIRKRGCATRLPAAMQRPRAGVTSRRRTPHCHHSRARCLRFCHPRARCAFFFPSPLGGRGEGEGAAGATSSLWVRPPLCLRLRLRGASPPLLDPLPRWGRGIRKRGCATRVPAAMQRPRAGVTSRRRTPHCRHSRARVRRARGIPGSAAAADAKPQHSPGGRRRPRRAFGRLRAGSEARRRALCAGE